MYWQDKTVMITGASSGIGRGLAVELSRRGAKLGLIARRADKLAELVREVEETKGKAIALPADVMDVNSLAAAATQLRSTFGPIDVLIANAGVGATVDGAELRGSTVASVINVNVLGAANSVEAVVPEMVQRGSG